MSRNSLLETGKTFEVSISETSDIVPVSSKEFLDTQATIECRFTLKRICEMIITHIYLRRNLLPTTIRTP